MVCVITLLNSVTLPVKTQLSVGYHYFKADHNSRKYGEEWNLTASRNFAYGIGAQFKLADFRALNRTQKFCCRYHQSMVDADL